MSNYDDIIDRERRGPKKRAPMSMHSRAAQFASFAALRGFDEKIDETARFAEDLADNADGSFDPSYLS